MQSAFFDHFTVVVNSSRIYLIGSIIVESLAIASVWLASIPWLISSALTLLILFVSVKSNHRFVFLAHPQSIRQLQFKDKCWFLRLVNSKEVRVKVAGDVLTTTFLIALKLRDSSSGKTYPLVLFKDTISPDKHRRLRVLLKVRP